MSGRRYPFEPLERLVVVRLRDRADAPERVGTKSIAVALGEDTTTIRRARKSGLLLAAAERMAEAAGFVPYEVWPELLAESITEVSVPCAECGTRFVPSRSGHRFCQRACYHRAYQREYQRRRYASDPEFRQRKVEDASRRYVEEREYRLARQRRYDTAKRAEARARRSESAAESEAA